jgi:hypothetical protein
MELIRLVSYGMNMNYGNIQTNTMNTQLFNLSNQGRLYHFTSSEIALKFILPTMKLKLSLFLNANDPKEQMSGTDFQIIKGCMNFDSIHLKDDFENYMQNCKHLCFTEDAGEHYGYKHSTMWEHYAEHTAGVCFLLDKQIFIRENSESLMNDKVEYLPHVYYPSIDFEEYKRNKSDKYFDTFIKQHEKQFFFCKQQDWSSEDEYKFITFNKNRNYCSIKNSLRYVIFGLKMENKLKFTFLKYLPSPHLAEMVFFEGRYICRQFSPSAYPSIMDNTISEDF